MKTLYHLVPGRHTPIILFLLFLIFPLAKSFGQVGALKSTNGTPHVNGKVSIYFLVSGGWGISTSFGTWIQYQNTQPSFNMSLSLINKASNLGNRNRYLTNYQVNAVLSPMITFGTQRGLYQEISPFYFGTLSSIYSNYQYSFTLGSSFVVMPRGVGRNIATFRNRTQQLIYVGLRGGSKEWDVNLNIYEDFFGTDNGALQGFADNYDRFYTGGGNLQVRSKNFKAKLYSEIYTGNFQRDLFDNPDLYTPYKSMNSRLQDNYVGRGQAKRHPRYVTQEPGQKLFNTGRTFLALEFSPELLGLDYQNGINTSYQVYFGFQGGTSQMTVQNSIHQWSKINKINVGSGINVLDLNTNSKDRERLHWFYPSFDQARFIGGAGLFLNTLPGVKK